jgi:hypothetical protein
MGAEQYFHLAFKAPQSMQAIIDFGYPEIMRPHGGARHVIERLFADPKCGAKRLLHECQLLIDFSFHPRVSGSEHRQVKFLRWRRRGIVLNQLESRPTSEKKLAWQAYNMLRNSQDNIRRSFGEVLELCAVRFEPAS